MDFRNFLKDMGKRPANSTLDRIDNSMGYERDNCRWATPKEQARNKRNSRLITFDGQIKTLSEWAEIIGISRTTISARIKRGWSIERSIKTPPNNG